MHLMCELGYNAQLVSAVSISTRKNTKYIRGYDALASW